MELKFLPVVVAVFMINFSTAVTGDHHDCFKYDAVVRNGKKKIDLYYECGITDAKTVNNEGNVKCLAKAFKVVNKDGSINRLKLIKAVALYTYPEYKNKVLDMLKEVLEQHPEKLYTLYPQGVAKICPKDQIYGNPDD